MQGLINLYFKFRWSLIAGRIPGRTANDVKNFWNTHIDPRSKQQKKERDADETVKDAKVTIIQPQPHNLYMSYKPQILHDGYGNIIRSSNEGANNNVNVSSLSPNVQDDKINQYLDELFNDREIEIEGDIGWSFGECLAQVDDLIVVAEEDDNNSVQVEALNVVGEEANNNSFFDFSLDEVMWNPMDSQ